MADEVKRNPFAARSGARPGAPGAAKHVVGPTLREQGGSMPCGCKVGPDEENKIRFWFCPPHAVAYELLEVLQQAQTVLDDIANNAPDDYDPTMAMDVSMKARKVIKKAKGDWR
jgi:hypothetical protein